MMDPVTETLGLTLQALNPETFTIELLTTSLKSCIRTPKPQTMNPHALPVKLETINLDIQTLQPKP